MPSDAPLPALSAAQRVPRLAMVAAVVLLVGGAFLYAGGWLSPHKLTPARFIDTFEEVNGVHPGFRRNHPKGVGVSGTFDASGQASRLSKAGVFRPGRVAVMGRFALAGGMPYAADAVDTVLSMALQFSLPDDEQWRTGMNAMPVFPVNTPEAFHDLLIATRPVPGTGKPDAASAQAFFARHPETARAIQTIKAQTRASGFADSTFNSLNAFELVDEAGRSTPVRWSMVPAEPRATALAPPKDHANFLFDDLIDRLHQQPLRWHLVMILGQPGDSTADATVAWPADRERVEAGTLTLDHIESEETSVVRTINFDPLVLPAGIAPSDDPLLSARSAAYAQSFTRRVGEPVPPSAVTPAEVGSGSGHE